jgi:hypothetical protein
MMHQTAKAWHLDVSRSWLVLAYLGQAWQSKILGHHILPFRFQGVWLAGDAAWLWLLHAGSGCSQFLEQPKQRFCTVPCARCWQ